MTREDLNGTTMCVCVFMCALNVWFCVYQKFIVYMANVLMYMFNPER